MKKTRRISRSPFRRRTRRSRMRGGGLTAWQRLKRSKRENPKIVEKYLGYLAENSPKAKDYLEQFPWLETVPPAEIHYNNTPNYNVNSEKELAIRACTLDKVTETLGEAPKFFDRCYENPKPCYHIFSKNVNLTLGGLIIRSKNKCLSELAEHSSKYKSAVKNFYASLSGVSPRDGETYRSPYDGSYGEEPPYISEGNRRDKEEYELSRRGI